MPAADTAAPPFWSPVVAGLQPYVPGEQPRMAGLVKLNTNENPYPPSPRAIAAIEAAARGAHGGLQLYPDPQAQALREAIAARHALSAPQVFVGNGSDEVLAHAFFAFFQHASPQASPPAAGEPLLMPDVTYSFYRVYCGLYGIAAQPQPLDARLRIDVEALAARAAAAPCAGIVLANPNAPTGIGLPLAAIERLLAACPHRVVLVDEAYVDFGGESAVGLVAKYPNLLVVHTLSKSRSLAGLRVGVAFGQRHLVEALERVKDSFNSYPLDRLAQAGAQAAYQDEAYFAQTRRAVMDSREGLTLGLEDLGFEVLPSQANFVFARHPARDAAQLAAALRERAVLVRHFARPERIAQYLRISVGTPAQCDTLLRALAEILA
ncbi:histidinol-phosphate transaminase [Ramlibacter sp. H39-3-26]|uniref:pyridoxal phosphate-dependent aminotransferase n=1 Tax=Curvibacter soli TaxID=3031331 RepID=UPI0023DB2024|nr:histidinol-phosphate transaminase [Ramlibacter sp. H39-3-26]MDF1486142.1 histidinol-phosphate transaminase [Ramlibacter sp. H39-3-26]